MSEQNGQSRSEKPTQKKLLDSRKKGEIARSRELSTTVMMLVSAIGLILFGGEMGSSFQRLLEADLSFDRRAAFDSSLVITALRDTVFESLWLISPFLVLMMVTAFAGPLMLGGWAFSLSAWQPKFSRLSPLSGIKRMFGVQGLVEMIKAFGKFLVIAAVSIAAIFVFKDRFFTLGQMPLMAGIQSGFWLIGLLFLALSLSLILISLIDVPYQIVSHTNRLKMSIQEVREEAKQTNGNPELKGRIRAMQREVSQRRMLQDVVEADVVIVNPTHYSVALKYDSANSGAPVVVAKGIDHMALRIREVASGNEVMIFSAPPLARALHRHSEVGEEVPTALYYAVAQVLAYVYQIQQASGSEKAAIQKPVNLEIPEEFVNPEDSNRDDAG